MCPVRINVEKYEKGTHHVPAPNHGESGAVDDRRDMGDTGGGGSAVSGRDTVGSYLPWTQTEDRG